MAALVYPASLPGPVAAPRTAAERRAMGERAGAPLQARAQSRDWLARHELEFVFTPAEMATFLSWWRHVLTYGGAWFAAHGWPSADPSIGGVYQFQGGLGTVHRGVGVQTVRATLQERGRGVDPRSIDYEIDLHCEDNAGGDASVGITLTGLDPSLTYEVRVVERTYTAWSRWSADSDPFAAGLPWECSFRVTTSGGTTDYLTTRYTTAAGALAAAQAAPAITITGYASYTFWLFDNLLGDNRGGLSLAIG